MSKERVNTNELEQNITEHKQNVNKKIDTDQCQSKRV